MQLSAELGGTPRSPMLRVCLAVWHGRQDQIEPRRADHLLDHLGLARDSDPRGRQAAGALGKLDIGAREARLLRLARLNSAAFEIARPR